MPLPRQSQATEAGGAGAGDGEGAGEGLGGLRDGARLSLGGEVAFEGGGDRLCVAEAWGGGGLALGRGEDSGLAL